MRSDKPTKRVSTGVCCCLCGFIITYTENFFFFFISNEYCVTLGLIYFAYSTYEILTMIKYYKNEFCVLSFESGIADEYLDHMKQLTIPFAFSDLLVQRETVCRIILRQKNLLN